MITSIKDSMAQARRRGRVQSLRGKPLGSALLEKIADYVARKGPVRSRDISAANGWTENYSERYLKALLAAGRVSLDPDGRYASKPSAPPEATRRKKMILTLEQMAVARIAAKPLSDEDAATASKSRVAITHCEVRDHTVLASDDRQMLVMLRRLGTEGDASVEGFIAARQLLELRDTARTYGAPDADVDCTGVPSEGFEDVRADIDTDGAHRATVSLAIKPKVAEFPNVAKAIKAVGATKAKAYVALSASNLERLLKLHKETGGNGALLFAFGKELDNVQVRWRTADHDARVVMAPGHAEAAEWAAVDFAIGGG